MDQYSDPEWMIAALDSDGPSRQHAERIIAFLEVTCVLMAELDESTKGRAKS